MVNGNNHWAITMCQALHSLSYLTVKWILWGRLFTHFPEDEPES